MSYGTLVRHLKSEGYTVVLNRGSFHINASDPEQLYWRLEAQGMIPAGCVVRVNDPVHTLALSYQKGTQ